MNLLKQNYNAVIDFLYLLLGVEDIQENVTPLIMHWIYVFLPLTQAKIIGVHVCF